MNKDSVNIKLLQLNTKTEVKKHTNGSILSNYIYDGDKSALLLLWDISVQEDAEAEENITSVTDFFQDRD